uniref:Reverse transcriptase domain-containing protein n=1 Tax=Plectus sambesii TaxID=2011161 RepID=A0A914WI85_9BILA
MKLFEQIINACLRDITEIAANQFRFMPGRSTTDAIFALRILTEKFREKKQQLHLAFLVMEKAYDRVPWKLIWWALRKKNVPEAYVGIIHDMYAAAATTVRKHHVDRQQLSQWLLGSTKDWHSAHYSSF